MPVQQQLNNYVQTTLASGCTNVATVLTLTSVAGLPTSGNFMLRIDDTSPATTFEYVEVSSVNVGLAQVTCARGQEGTSGIAHSAGAFVGNDLTAAMLTRAFALGIVPGGYQEIIGGQTGITAVVDISGLAVTYTTPANRTYEVTGYCPEFDGSVAGDIFQLLVVEDGTVVGRGTVRINAAAPTLGVEVIAIAIRKPSAGSHTWKLQAFRQAGSGTGTVNAAVGASSWICVKDIGQA